MIVRADSLEAGMSRYLVERITAQPKITVLTGMRVIAAGGRPRLETVTIIDREGQQSQLRADAMYVLIGGQTDWRRHVPSGWLGRRRVGSE